MGRDFAQPFYNSKAWKDCREAYKQKTHFLCERCLANGLFVYGEIVHHKVHLTPENINDPKVSLSFDNLELLCRNHHAKEHNRTERGKRYYIDDQGRVIIRENIE